MAYGEHPRQRLDFWQAESQRPAPLVIFIHGGGFKGGDKRMASGRFGRVIERCLAAGVSFASLNYRLLGDGVALPGCLRDAARAVQFLRHHAADFHLDPERIGAFGTSAGAGTSLWLAVHDDLADPDADDPVLRESSRLRVAGCISGQCTYDVLRWPELVGEFGEAGFTDEEALRIYGMEDAGELRSPEGERLRAGVDMMALFTADDAPLFLQARGSTGPPRSRGHYIHHPRHAERLKEKADRLGVASELLLLGEGRRGGGERPVRRRDPDEALLRFFFRHLGVGGGKGAKLY